MLGSEFPVDGTDWLEWVEEFHLQTLEGALEPAQSVKCLCPKGLAENDLPRETACLDLRTGQQ